MYAMIAFVVHAALGSAAAMAIAPHSRAAGATFGSMGAVHGVRPAFDRGAGGNILGTVAAPAANHRHHGGWLCGVSCGAVLGLSIDPSLDYSVILYLALLAPTLLAVLLASVLDRPKSGWQV